MGKLISVSFVFSNNIWVVCSQLLSVEGILFCNGSQNAVDLDISICKIN